MRDRRVLLIERGNKYHEKTLHAFPSNLRDMLGAMQLCTNVTLPQPRRFPTRLFQKSKLSIQ
jgi:hypothetical protein